MRTRVTQLVYLLSATLAFIVWMGLKVWRVTLQANSGPNVWDRRKVAHRPTEANYGAEQFSLATYGHPQWLMLTRVAILPSLFTVLLHALFAFVFKDPVFADEAFNSETDCISQAMFTVLALCHVVFYFVSDWHGGMTQRTKVIDILKLQGHESVVNVNCGRGFWANEIGGRLESGKLWGVDVWGSRHTPYDQQWLIYNSACEGTESAIEPAGSWDLYTLPFLSAEHDVMFSAWLPWYDEVGAERVMHEMLRCLKPGGRICVVLPKFYHNCVEHILHNTGVLDLVCQEITTGFYVSHQVFSGVKSTMLMSRAMGQPMAVLPGEEHPPWLMAHIQYVYLLLGCALWLLHLAAMCVLWDTLHIPEGVSTSSQLGPDFIAQNVTWLGLVLVEIHMELTMRPRYVLQQYGWTKAWALIATHHSITALLWNLGCWLPGLLVEQLFEINNMGLQIALSVPCIAVVMAMEKRLLGARMRRFLSAFEASSFCKPLCVVVACTCESLDVFVRMKDTHDTCAVGQVLQAGPQEKMGL